MKLRRMCMILQTQMHAFSLALGWEQCRGMCSPQDLHRWLFHQRSESSSLYSVKVSSGAHISRASTRK